MSFNKEEYRALENVMGVEEASTIWGLSAGYIKNLCANGTVRAKRIGNTWIIDKNQENPGKNNKLEFTDEQIKERFIQFVNDFLSAEDVQVEKPELLPGLWAVSVPSKEFKATIELKRIGMFHGIEEWAAVVEKDGEKNNFLLFEKEIEEWASEQRRIRGIEK